MLLICRVPLEILQLWVEKQEEERCVHKQREMRKGKSLEMRGRMNVRTMTMKDKELVDRSKGEGLALILMDMLVRETEVMRMRWTILVSRTEQLKW